MSISAISSILTSNQVKMAPPAQVNSAPAVNVGPAATVELSAAGVSKCGS